MQTAEQIRQHYEVEKELAERLRRSDRADRGALYGSIYDELLRRVPHHPYLEHRDQALERRRETSEQMTFLSRFLRPDTVFLEIGAGSCNLSHEVAKRVRVCHALDVSREILDVRAVSNVNLILSDGCSVPVAAGSVTLAYSNQVMEHIHPDDAVEQLGNIFRALAPGGLYLCSTPNRLNGPHDVSRPFDDVATGLHLKEYTLRELVGLFRRAGFRRIVPYVQVRRWYPRTPLGPLMLFESLFGRLPARARKRLGMLKACRHLLAIRVAAAR